MFGENRAVFLDRDGVLNKALIREGKPFPPISLHETVIVPGARFALPILKREGFFLIGITNQPDVARGKQNREVVEAINSYILNQLPILEIFVCFHDNNDNCDCRKPKPGLLLQAAIKYEIDLAQSYMVGDRWKDTESGKRAGCNTIFIDYKYNEDLIDHKPDYSVNDVSKIIEIIIPNWRK
jgi:D-glycero-D-manno-heptose 1,7-bisphosphate phosphatase